MSSEKEKWTEAGQFLTDNQWKYLADGDLSDVSTPKSTIRYRLRLKTKGALHDLGTVAGQMKKEDRESFFNLSKPAEQEPNEWTEMPDGKKIPLPQDEKSSSGLWGNVGIQWEMIPIMKFYYLTLRENGIPRDMILSSFEYAIKAAEGEFRHGSPEGVQEEDVDVSIEVTTPEDVDIEKAKRRLKAGSPLTPMQMKALETEGHAELVPTE